jgi:hypothetical protein
MSRVTAFKRAVFLFGATTLTAGLMSTGTAHADDPAEEYLCADVTVEDDHLTQAAGCVGGPVDYTGPANVTAFLGEEEWICESVTTEVDPDQDDPKFSRITETTNCVLNQQDDDPGE